MRNIRKILPLLLCCVMLLAFVAACNDDDAMPGGPGTTPGGPGSSGPGPQGEVPVVEGVDWNVHQEFTVWMYSTQHDLYSGYSNNPVMNYLNNRFNVTLSFIQPVAGTEADALALMFGTGQYNHLIDVTSFTGSIGELYADGVIINVAEYLQYMPNLVARMEADPNIRKQFYNDDGQILTLTNFSEENQLAWGGLVYRHDLLEMMTGGNVFFPSGNPTPTTVEDWDYMLPLFKAFFEMAGMVEYAPLILPSSGTFWFGELMSGFGVPSPGFFYDTRTNVMNHGFLTNEMFNYLSKMNEWFAAGYIYQDFASRVNDMFFLPNPALTYGSAAGLWFGLSVQLGEAMSMPEHNLFFDVRPVATPIDTANGITGDWIINMLAPNYEDAVSFVVTAACPDIPKLLSIIDFMYSDEGGMLWSSGLTREQIPPNDTIYAAAGLQDGAYWFDANGTFVYNPQLDRVGGPIELSDVNGIRMPGFIRNSFENAEATHLREASAVWAMYDGYFRRPPTKLSFPLDDEALMNSRMVAINDYANSMIPRFIMGTEPLTRESFAAFQAQLISLGLEDNIRLQQAALDRYQNR